MQKCSKFESRFWSFKSTLFLGLISGFTITGLMLTLLTNLFLCANKTVWNVAKTKSTSVSPWEQCFQHWDLLEKSPRRLHTPFCTFVFPPSVFLCSLTRRQIVLRWFKCYCSYSMIIVFISFNFSPAVSLVLRKAQVKFLFFVKLKQALEIPYIYFTRWISTTSGYRPIFIVLHLNAASF